MINNTVRVLVTLFFLHGAIASFITGQHFWLKKDRTVKFFGIALLFTGAAFLLWAFLVANMLNDLRILATAAAAFLILALYTYYVAGIQHLDDSASYLTALIVGAFGALGLFILRTFVYPAHLIITSSGFLLFDLKSIVKVAYVLAISISLLPAANALAGKFEQSVLSSLFKGCFTTIAIGGIILAVSKDTTLILFDGIAMSVAFLMLWITILFEGKKALKKIT